MDHPLTLLGFMEMYATQDACRRALLEQRRREGFRCPRCAHAVAWYLRGRGPCDCAGCGYQVSLTAGTLLHKTRTDLCKWLPAIWLLRRKSTHATSRTQSPRRRPPASRRPPVHIVTPNFTRWRLDIFPGASAAHLQSCLDEFCYRLWSP